MNTKTLLIPLTLFFLAGAFFLGKGITAFVVSQSCCFPPDCAQEDICPVAQNSPELYLGTGLVVVSVALYFVIGRVYKGNRKIYTQ